MARKQSVQKGFVLLSISGFLLKFVSLFFVPVMVSLLGDEANGMYATAAKVFAFAYVITNSGTLNAIIKITAEYSAVRSKEEAYRAFKVSTAMLSIIGGLIGLLIFIFAQDIANIMKAPEAGDAIRVLAPGTLLTAVVCSYRGYFQGLSDYRPRAVSQLLEQIVHVIASISLTLVAINVFGTQNYRPLITAASAGTTIGSLISVFYVLYYFFKHKDIDKGSMPALTKDKLKEYINVFFRYSVPLTASAGLQNAASLVDAVNVKSRLMVIGFTEYQANGMFSWLYKWEQLINVPAYIAIALASTVLPKLSVAAATKDKEAYVSNLRYAYRWCLLIAIPSAIGLSILSAQIYRCIGYSQGSEIMLLGSFVVIFMAITQVHSSVLQSMGKMYLLTVTLLIGVIVKIVLNYFLIAIPVINVNGAIIGSIVGYLVTVVLNERYILRHAPYKVKVIKFFVKPTLAAIVMGAVVYLSYMLYNGGVGLILSMFMANASVAYINVLISTILAIITGICVYMVILIYLGAIKNRDLEMVPQKIQRFIPRKLYKRIEMNGEVVKL